MFQEVVSRPGLGGDEHWILFMETIMSKKTPTLNMLVHLAKELEKEGEEGITDRVKEKSRLLVQHLFSRTDIWNDPDITSISSIRFLAPYEVDKQYTDIHPQKSSNQKLIAFTDSVPARLTELAWTTHTILSLENDPSLLSETLPPDNLQTIHNKLNICLQPSLEDVILHIQNVCNSLKTLLDNSEKRRNAQSDVIDELVTIFYDTLLQNIQDCIPRALVEQKLLDTPIIFLKEDMRMMPARQTILHLPEEQVIKPYLFKTPLCYMKFSPLFEHLGMAVSPTANHFANVLCAQYQDTSGEDLHPKQLECAFKAVKNLFQNLNNDIICRNNELTVDTLYLPSNKNRLVKSTELIFLDTTRYGDRLVHQDNMTFFVGFQQLGMNFIDPLDAISKLPSAHQPRMLSSVIRENLIKVTRMNSTGQKTRELQKIIGAPEFWFAIFRLIRHQEGKQSSGKQNEKPELIMKRITSIKLIQASVIETQLIFNDQPNGSSRAVEYFTGAGNNDSAQEYILYINEETECDSVKWMCVISELIQLLVLCVHSLLQGCDKYLTDMLSVFVREPENISLYLDKMKIRKCDVTFDFTNYLFPPVGTIVSPKFYHLLDNSFSEFRDRENVAVEMFDSAIDSGSVDTEGLDAHFIYGTVSRRIEDDGSYKSMPAISHKYSVDIGDEEIEVPAMNIYKFRENEKSKLDFVDSADAVQTHSNLSLEHIRQEIREMLVDSWSLPEVQRKRIIKRLILNCDTDRDNTTGDNYQFIQNILTRLKNDEIVDYDEVDSKPRFPKTASSYHNFSERMHRRGHSYAARSMQPMSALYEDYMNEQQPNILESRRWMRQAQCDLDAVRNTINVTTRWPSFNWVCYKCQQGAEKALKAAWYTRDSRKVIRSHNLPEVASGLGEQLEQFAKELQYLIGSDTKMRYPDAVRMPHIPSDVYTREMAEQAYDLTHNIVKDAAILCI